MGFTLALAACLAAAEPAWEDLSPGLVAAVPGYAPYGPGERGVAGMGMAGERLYVGLMCAPFGLWTSADAGSTWTRADAGQVAGTAPRSGSIAIDDQHLVCFRSTHPGPGTSAWSGDGGATWTAITSPKSEGYAGYAGLLHGLACWQDHRPSLILAVARADAGLYRSSDGGATWTAQPTGAKGSKAELACVDSGMITQAYLKPKDPIRGYGLASDGTVLVGRDSGIHRLGSDGVAVKVSDVRVTALQAVRDGDRLWWLAETGVVASDDGGATWTVVGTPPVVLHKGPYIGGQGSLLAVGKDGICRSRDRGVTWQVVAQPRHDASAWRADQEGAFTRTDYAWDAARGWLFSAGLAGTLARLPMPR